MDSDKDYAVAKEIVQSGQSDEDWDNLRLGKGAWPEDERKGWKQYRKYSMDKLQEMMESYKKPNGAHAIYSPRLRGSVYVLAYIPPNAFPRLLGTAWAVESQSQQLLLTALHCLDPELNPISFEALQDHLYIAKSIQLNDDNTTTIDAPISVRAIDACRVSDVAVLRSTTPLPDPISLCPQQELPSVDHEEAVKTYHVPCQSFPADIPIASAMATDYTKIIMQSNHHYFVPGEHMHGSSGGVVVDRRGRAVGLISSGFVPGIKLPLPDSFKTLWETVSALSEGRGTYTRCVKVNVVNGLYEYCASH